MYQPRNEVVQAISAALEASVYVAPTDSGLTYAELVEVASRLDIKRGELDDTLGSPLSRIVHERGRFGLPDTTWQTGLIFWPEQPERRNIQAFDFVIQQLNETVSEVGARAAVLDRRVLIERAAAMNLEQYDIEVALALLMLGGRLAEDSNGIRFRVQSGRQALQSENNRLGRPSPTSKVERERVLPIVRDVISRRKDGRPKYAESLDAFADTIAALGYPQFRAWWFQTLNEQRRSDPVTSPIASLVLSAALVEAALTFIVKYVRSLNIGFFASSDYDKEPHTWKLDVLLRSASGGGADAIFDSRTRDRVHDLIQNRQRIHAGRMITDFSTVGVPDLKPEQAREAKAIAEQATRKILDWLDAHRPTGST